MSEYRLNQRRAVTLEIATGWSRNLKRDYEDGFEYGKMKLSSGVDYEDGNSAKLRIQRWDHVRLRYGSPVLLSSIEELEDNGDLEMLDELGDLVLGGLLNRWLKNESDLEQQWKNDTEDLNKIKNGFVETIIRNHPCNQLPDGVDYEDQDEE